MDIISRSPELFNSKNPAAFFDIDHTIIIPQGKRRMYSAANGFKWNFLFHNTIERMRSVSKSHNIYFVTNQSKYDEVIRTRIIDMMEKIDIPCVALIATERNTFRKPGVGFLETKLPGGFPNITSESFHCGDAVGRQGDFSDDDLWFGIHAGVQVYSPEEFFAEDFSPSNYGPIEYIREPIVDDGLIDKLRHIYEHFDGVMLMGLPGSGKSSIRKWYQDHYDDIGVFNNDEGLSAPGGKKFYILDNTNMTEYQRQSYPEYIKNAKIVIIFSDLDPKKCIRGIKYRTTIQGEPHIPDVAVYSMNKKRQIPDSVYIHLKLWAVLDKNFPPYLLN